MNISAVAAIQPDRVLIVEDDPNLQRVISRILQQDGYEPATASSGAEALDVLSRFAIDLMLVDYNLSDMRADQLIEQMRQAGHAVPFVVATGQGNETIAVEMMKRGAKDYLVKSSSFLKLLPTVVARVLTEARLEQRLARAEHALRVSEERLRTVIDASGAGIWSWDLLRNEGFWSERVYEILDLPHDSPVWGLEETLARIHPDDRAAVQAQVEGGLGIGQLYRFEVRVQRSGEYVWLSVVGKTQCEADGNPTRVSGSVLDVTQLKLTAEALQQSEERYRRLVEFAPEAIFVIQNYYITYANDAALRLFGANALPDLVGRQVLDLLHADDHEQTRQRIERLMEGGASLPVVETKICRLNGQVVEVDSSATRCTYDNKPAMQVLLRDVSQRKRHEALAREHQNQLAHAMRFNTMGKMVSELAHEINQPLYAIANYGSACRELLAADPEAYPPEVWRWVEQIAEQANRAGEIIRQVSQFVRKQPPHRSLVAVSDLLLDIVRLLEIDAQVHRARIRLEPQSENPRVLADRVQIEQVLVNLVVNAIEAMDGISPADRELSIRSSCRAGEVEISIRDAGSGVAAEDCAQLFEPFFTTKDEGMGMGLSISRSIVETHGGRLWAVANAEGGMTFTFTLPLAPRPLDSCG